MKKINIMLKKKTGVTIPENTVLEDSADLVLHIDSDYDMTRAKILLKNGDVTDEYPFKSDFIVPDKFLFKGRLFISVAMYSRQGALIKKWEFFPIAVRLEDGKTVLYDYLTDLEKRVAILEERTKIIL